MKQYVLKGDIPEDSQKEKTDPSRFQQENFMQAKNRYLNIYLNTY
jgi:hypothetical protein